MLLHKHTQSREALIRVVLVERLLILRSALGSAIRLIVEAHKRRLVLILPKGVASFSKLEASILTLHHLPSIDRVGFD